MLIFNTTFHTEKSVNDVCLQFFREVYIPRAIESGLLSSPSISKVHPQHGETGVTYAIQFKAESIEILNLWAEQTGEDLSKELVGKFGDKVAGFPTLLEEVDL